MVVGDGDKVLVVMMVYFNVDVIVLWNKFVMMNSIE